MSQKTRDSSQTEAKWYAYWQEKNFFQSTPTSKKKPYVIAMPPPNVTGILHFGHVLNQTIQDVLARLARMQNKEVCWVPGLDHASVATEAKVVARLAKRNLTKKTLGRTLFLEEAWKWKEEHENIILTQLKRLGISCDWRRLHFTMDPKLSQSVIQSFVHLYEKKLLYRAEKIIHWDPLGQTTLSNEEVLYRPLNGKLYYINYSIVDSQESITVATSRPETILGDTALCVHPKDPRYLHLHSANVYVPLTNRIIPLITDPYVDQTFGTGCLKVTPGHDPNDYELAERHQLPILSIFTKDGKLNTTASLYVGETISRARDLIVLDLKKKKQLVKTVSHIHNVGFSERTGAIIEPRISMQWFLKMKELAQPAIESVRNGTITFYPPKFVNTYLHWMENIHDWCISRQLWWGQRIPVYYLPDGQFVVATTIEKALQKAKLLTGNQRLTTKELQQDSDVLDTWFSSWLWPMSIFDGLLCPNNPDYTYYYPTHDVVTAPEIIFFWVARMIMASYEFSGKPPFKNVYFTGIVRDKQRRKMSKFLGNSPDPVLLIKKYGADGVRVGVLFCSAAGNDLLFDEKLCVQGHQFIHKIHNAWKLVNGWTPVAQPATSDEKIVIRWFRSSCNQAIQTLLAHFRAFRLSEALMCIYKLIWDNFCAHYLEMVKPKGNKEIAKEVYEASLSFFETLMKLLHPFMPFITEEIWHQLRPRKEMESIVIAPYPTSQAVDTSLLTSGMHAIALITRLRKHTHNQPKNQKPMVLLLHSPKPTWLTLFGFYVIKATNLSDIKEIPSRPHPATAFIIAETTFSLPVSAGEKIGNQKELLETLVYQEKFLASVTAKLTNVKFLANAPQSIVDREKKKCDDAKKRIASLKNLLSLSPEKH